MTFIHWTGFILLIFVLLFLDLGIFHKKDRKVSLQDAIIWSGIWILISLSFNVFIYFAYKHHWLELGLGTSSLLTMDGKDAALKFFTGYILEKSLSVDNLFVIAMVFSYFKTPLKYQHEILFWGILGALIFRGIMIISGAALLNTFSWVTYFFGALLIFSSIKMLSTGRGKVYPEKNPVINFLKRFYPVSDNDQGGKFFVRLNGVKAITPLFIVLIVIETSDAMFAVDSIPAVLAVTTDALIVFTSNVFAILGLRSLYFVLATFMNKFRYLKISLVFVLAFVGAKMLLIHYIRIPILISLAIIGGILLSGILSSLLFNKEKSHPGFSPVEIPDTENKPNDDIS